MRGIVGIIGEKAVATHPSSASAGSNIAATIPRASPRWRTARSARRRAEGSCAISRRGSKAAPLLGETGIGHTRWATHGKPTEANAHPHMTDDVSVVHNGIIENFRELKEELRPRAHAFTSDTDTEVIAHLITRRDQGRQRSGAAPSITRLKRLEGAFAIAMIFRGYNDLMIVARQGSPLAIGYGEGEMFVGSDALALAPFTDEVAYLEDGDWAVLTREGVAIRDRDRKAVQRAVTRSLATALLVDKGNHRHFMAKEIHEQPEVVGHTLANTVDLSSNRHGEGPGSSLDFAQLCAPVHLGLRHGVLRRPRRQILVRALGAPARRRRYRLEFRYRQADWTRRRALFISQSGETADTLATLRYCRGRASVSASIVNVRNPRSPANPTACCRRSRRSGDRRRLHQGLHLPAADARLPRHRRRQAQRGHIGEALEAELVQALAEVPRHMATVLRDETPTRRSPRACRERATCSISVGAKAIRSPSKAR